MSDLRIVLRSLRSRLTSTIVTVAMVAVAVALLLTLLSLRQAGKDSFRRGVGNAHLVVSADASPLVAVLNGLFYVNAPRNSIPYEKISEIRKQFPWAWAIPTQLGDSFRGFPRPCNRTRLHRELPTGPRRAMGKWPRGAAHPLRLKLHWAQRSRNPRAWALATSFISHMAHPDPPSRLSVW